MRSTTRRWSQGTIACVLAWSLTACGGAQGRGESGLGPGLGDGGDDADAGTSSGGLDVGDPPDPSDSDDAGVDDSTGADPPPTAQACSYPSTSFGGAQQQLDVPTGSTNVLAFTVLDVPDPSLVDAATLSFTSYDADHPGEEGVVWINGSGPFDLPADPAWDNADGSGTIDITGTLVAGTNLVEFGAGSLVPRTVYSIGDVRIDALARVETCQEQPEPPPADAVPRQIDFWDASYGMRHNWVLRCDGFEYAFTASGADHLDSDCEGLYAPDGSRRGTATFLFTDVVPATYEIQIHSRHTVNRNPNGALFVVDGEGLRVNQRDDADFTTDVWGTRPLGGDVTVVLDSSQESESDSVVWIRLEPVAG